MMSFNVFASADSLPDGTASDPTSANTSSASSQTAQTTAADSASGSNGTNQVGAQDETPSRHAQVGPQASCSPTTWVDWGTPYSGSTGVSGMDRSTVQWRITSDCVLHLSGGLSPNIPNSSTYVPWINEQDEITAIKVEGNLTLYKSNIALNPIFADIPNLTTVDTTGGQLHLAANATAGLFESDDALATINGITSWDTSKATGMASMFYACTGLRQLDLSGFNTANVVDMSDMFDGDTALTSIAFSGSFATGKVTSMYKMFNNCAALTSASLDLSNFDTHSVKSLNSMFAGCSDLTSLNLSNFNTSNVTDMSGMFQSCRDLTSVNLSSFVTTNVTTMNSMFNDCVSLTSWGQTNFSTPLVTDMGQMFAGCTNLTTLDISSFDTSQAGSSMSSMLPKGLRKLKLGASTKLDSNAFADVNSGINWEEMSSLDDSATHIGHIGNLSTLQTRAASGSPAGSYWDSTFMPSGVQLAINANGGTANFTPVSYDTTTAPATITVPQANMITANKSQNIFSGWDTCASGGTSGGCKSYQPNDTITVAKGDSYPTRTITLYAQWVRAPAPVIDPYSPAIHAPLTTSPTIDVTVSNTAGPAGGPAANALIGSTTTITTGQGPWSTETGPGTWSYTGRPIADLQPNMGAPYVINAVTTMTDPSTGNTVSTSTRKNGMLPYLKVTFNANGGTGAPADMSGYGDPGNNNLTGFTIPANVIPTKGPHDMFAGWATSATATQPDPAYNPGNHAPTYWDSSRGHDDSGKTLTLYAVWHEAKAPVITEVHRDPTSHHVIATGTSQPWNVIGGAPTLTGNSSRGLKITGASITSDNKLTVTGLATGVGANYESVVTVRVRACAANNSSTAPPQKTGWSNDNNNIPAGCSQIFGIPAYSVWSSFPFWLSGLNTEWTAANLDISGKPYVWIYVQYQSGPIDGPLMLTNPSVQGSDNSVKTCVKPSGTSASNYVCGTATMDNASAFDGTTAHSWSLDLPESTAFDNAKNYDTSSHLYINDIWRQPSGGTVISPEAYLGVAPPATILPFTGGIFRRIAMALAALIGAVAVLLATFVAFRRRILRRQSL
ncbi:BspA family leucine-rich repeat surface protein [Bifidobacterium sp. ESL0745]|uniref:BspA family leucine-rich repeat surface protein n=1 Tax=Bifidobacterium sp. ESL0745 TaxID=2983226 RepID=UPI0023F9C581|nr:BspA family leucine-rich repeat surface protein [Bifidobacterium sp. ESL0745]MDF7665901.1 BspA family leucine-rich repeat surface protein [Bifidobacterium sp. ESL0745]